MALLPASHRESDWALTEIDGELDTTAHRRAARILRLGSIARVLPGHSTLAAALAEP